MSSSTPVNELFAPLPSLCALYAVMQALPKYNNNSIIEIFEFNKECLQELRNCIASQPRLPPSTMFSFIKIIVDDDEKILVSDVFMRKMRDLATDEVVLSCSPLKVGRVLRSLTGGVIDGPRSKYGLSTFYTTAGLKASWCGTATVVNPSAFASSYCLRQKHPFIQLETDAKKITSHNCEIWEVPLRASTFQFHLCLIRPRFLGDIVKLKSRLSGQDLRDIFEELLRVKTKRHKLLIPVFSLKCEENLACMWMKKGKSYMSESEVLPPIDAIWNITKLSISVDGVGTHDFKLKPHPRLPPSYRSYMNFDSIHHSHTTYAASIDSSFIFIITQRGKIPLLAGCYAGHPSPCNLTFTFPAPERIRNKPPVKLTQKTRKKLSKKQKKALQLNRWRSDEIKKRAIREQLGKKCRSKETKIRKI